MYPFHNIIAVTNIHVESTELYVRKLVHPLNCLIASMSMKISKRPFEELKRIFLMQILNKNSNIEVDKVSKIVRLSLNSFELHLKIMQSENILR